MVQQWVLIMLALDLSTPRNLFLFAVGLPTPLAGHFLSPPVRTGASGHAWVSVDKQCHLHYEIVVAGLSKKEDVTVNAHLHGLAEIGELDNSSTTHKRLLTGFYGSQVHRFKSRHLLINPLMHSFRFCCYDTHNYQVMILGILLGYSKKEPHNLWPTQV